MKAQRFFVDGTPTPGSEIVIGGADAHHAVNVLRLGAGAPVRLIAGGVVFDGELLRSSGNSIVVRVGGVSVDQLGELPVAVVVVQAIGKAAKFDDVVEKCVELGATRIIPARCARNVSEHAGKVERWQRIARAAAQQSRRRILPDVEQPQDVVELLGRLSATHLALVADPGAPARSLADALAAAEQNRPLALFVGPEGGFTEVELASARAASAKLVSLGPTTLRTETAAAALLAAAAALRAWW